MGKPRLKLFLTTLLALVCGLSSASATNVTTASGDDVILEVITTGYGMVFPEGDLLDYRLWADGRFEFQRVEAIDPTESAGRAGNGRIEQYVGKLDAATLDELVALLRDKSIRGARARYRSKLFHVDDEWVTRVRVWNGKRAKTIELTNFWDILSHPDEARRFPAGVVRLLEKTRALRSNEPMSLGRTATLPN